MLWYFGEDVKKVCLPGSVGSDELSVLFESIPMSQQVEKVWV